ncbi:hypothetical protein HD806DRAFT_504255 [Xylariaceae sp. AK1471]|nr:hypothetical protein HD806DRAFT_504255 [Xylariaceae sp. AK1471]
MKFSTVLLATLPLCSAWHLQLYRDEKYIGVIEDRKGTFGQPCKNLGSKNVASSMHWDAGALNCEIVLYNDDGCKEQGGILGRSEGDWNLASFSSGANDKANSYKINC